MSDLRRRLSYANVIATLALFLAVSGGVAFAVTGIVDADGAIHGCYNTTNGGLRVVAAAESCKSNEAALTWSQRGPTGPKGDKGDAGTNGTDGAPGAKGDKGDRGTDGAPGPKGDAGPTGPSGVVGWAQGSSSLPGQVSSTPGFIGATAAIDISAGTKVHMTANQTLGANTVPPGTHPRLSLSPCYRRASTLTSVNEGEHSVSQEQAGSQLASITYVFSGLPAGTYEFGMCATATSDADLWDANAGGTVSLLAFK